MWKLVFVLCFSLYFSVSCSSQYGENKSIRVGAERIEEYLPLLQDKNVAIVANHTSYIGDQHLVDTLVAREVHVVKIFSPEHGFRGDKDPGELIDSYYDSKTGLPVVSLYGSSKKPTSEDLKNVDVVLFDIQDVGVRFYTYISTMHYVMEACAENSVKMMVLDRPNPNGFYVDGPVLDTQHRSFVGMHPIPLVHGMTVAELARMINGEGWLKEGVRCDLDWISCENYTHDSLYQLKIKPSPNLPNMQSIYLYPSLGLFEGTIMNVGRGTPYPFQVYGHPRLEGTLEYTPEPVKGASVSPKHKGKKCGAVDLRTYPVEKIFREPELKLHWLIDAYNKLDKPGDFFLPFFTNLTGTKELKKQIIEGKSISEIRESWSEDLDQFMQKRANYLLYEDFKQ